MVRQETIEAYLDRLSSASPTPGGGGAGALSGALGCALGLMVSELTAGRKKYAPVREDMLRIRGRLLGFRADFLRLADLDEEVFSAFMDALKLPKETDDEKETRRRAVSDALIRATEVPLRVMEKASEALLEVVFAAEKGNRNAVSDAGAAANMLLAALETGGENVRINLASMADEAKKAAFQERMDKALTEGRKTAGEILETVRRRVEGA